jgi:hypothetical protein
MEIEGSASAKRGEDLMGIDQAAEGAQSLVVGVAGGAMLVVIGPGPGAGGQGA